jgi:alpha-beta hydrolase superfamily lysophospholipase
VRSGPGLGSLPVLWAHGEADPLVPVDGSRSGVQQLTGGQHVERLYPGARHEVVNETNADEVLADVTSFIDETLRSRHDRARGQGGTAGQYT